MADEIRIGGGGYGPAEGLPHEPDQSQLPEESGLSQAEETEAGTQAANTQGQPSGPKSGDQPEEKPAAASTPGAPVRAPQQQRDDRRRLGPTTTPRKPVASKGSKDEKRLADGIDHVDDVSDEIEAGQFQEPEKADSRESNSGQEGDNRLAASAEDEKAAPSQETTGKGASGAGKSSSSANTASTAAAPSGSPGSIAKTTSGLGRESVKTTPAANQQTPGQAGSSSSPVTGKAQAPGRPAPDSLKLTLDGASSSLIRAKVSASKNGNPRASLGQPLGGPASPRPVSPISLRRLPTGEVVAGQKRAAIGSSPAVTGNLVADSLKRSAEGASSQLMRARLASNRQASLGPAVGRTQITGNGAVKPSSDQQKIQQIQLERRRRASTSF